MLQNRGYVVVQDAIDMATDEFRNRFGESPARGILFTYTYVMGITFKYLLYQTRGVNNSSRES